MNRAIGSWVCNSTWQNFKGRRFEISVPIPALIRVTAVKVEPEYSSLKIEGYFIEEYMKETPAALEPPGKTKLNEEAPPPLV